MYGETTGSERTGDQMRCDYAEEGLLTEIQFMFELNGRVFNVTRSPDQEVPKDGLDPRTAPKDEIDSASNGSPMDMLLRLRECSVESTG